MMREPTWVGDATFTIALPIFSRTLDMDRDGENALLCDIPIGNTGSSP